MQDSEPDHYDILSLHFSPTKKQHFTERELKLAYRRALLLHHPDKCANPTTNTSKYTVDQITIAYKSLADPVACNEYHKRRALEQGNDNPCTKSSCPAFETVDLDDLDFDEQDGVWYRGCRCGKDKAFVVTEEILDEHAEEGELLAGCQGCSLWLKIMFVEAEHDR